MTIIICLAGLSVVLILMGQKRNATTRYILNFNFDASVHRRLQEKYPQLNELQYSQLLDGLRDYLLICKRAGLRPVSMPSQGVDEVWHAFILSTRQYQAFCLRVYGRYLHHTPAEVMASPTQATEGLQRAWQLACQKENINPRKPSHLPRLFAIDAELGIAGGFIYSLDCQMAGAMSGSYCATAIGCGSGCGGDGGSADGGGHGCSSGCSSSGCGGGCGGD